MDSFYDFEMDKNAVQKLIDVKSACVSFEVYAGKSAVWKNFVLVNVDDMVGRLRVRVGMGFSSRVRVEMGLEVTGTGEIGFNVCTRAVLYSEVALRDLQCPLTR